MRFVMVKLLASLGVVGMLSLSACAAQPDQSVQREPAPETRVVTVQAGQGGPISVTIPETSANAPYALTGEHAQQAAPKMSVMRFGQGDTITGWSHE